MWIILVQEGGGSSKTDQRVQRNDQLDLSRFWKSLGSVTLHRSYLVSDSVGKECKGNGRSSVMDKCSAGQVSLGFLSQMEKNDHPARCVHRSLGFCRQFLVLPLAISLQADINQV